MNKQIKQKKLALLKKLAKQLNMSVTHMCEHTGFLYGGDKHRPIRAYWEMSPKCERYEIVTTNFLCPTAHLHLRSFAKFYNMVKEAMNLQKQPKGETNES